MPYRQQLHIHNIYIPPRSSCSAGHNASIAHLLSRSEWKLPLRDRITYRHCRLPKLPNFLYSSNTTSWRLMRRANSNNNLLSKNEMSLFVGDINAYHSRWHTKTNVDVRCEQLSGENDIADYIIHYENEATRLSTNGRITSHYIRLACNDIALLSDWPVST